MPVDSSFNLLLLNLLKLDNAYHNEPLKPFKVRAIKREAVSRFIWVWNHIEWQLAGDNWFNKVTILFLPFFV